MTPAERIRLIRAAAPTLAALPVEELQLTLNQFGVHTYDFVTSTWGTPSETPLGYSMGRLGDTSDETLQGLHDYLTGVDESSAGLPGHSPWQGGAATVFISHRHEDAAFAAQVAQVLTDWYTVDAFVAHVHISPSLMWRNQIRLGLATCDALVAVLHPEFHTSEWCDQEVGWALGRRIPILPVRRVPAPGVRHDGFLGDHQDCLISPTRGDGTYWVAKQTLEMLLREPRTRKKGIQAVVNSFARSNSWDHTRWLWSLLGDDPTVTPEQAAQLVAAAQTNVNVTQCVIPPAGHALPDLINALAARVTPEPEPETPPF